MFLTMQAVMRWTSGISLPQNFIASTKPEIPEGLFEGAKQSSPSLKPSYVCLNRMWHADQPPYDGLGDPRNYPDQRTGRRVECVALDQEDTMTRSSKLSVRRRRAGPRKIQSKIGRLLPAHHSSMVEEPLSSVLRSFVVQLLAIEARKHHSTARAIEVLRLAAAPIGRNSNGTDRRS